MYNYTPEDLILYLYNETTPQVKAAIEEAILNDWTLREKLAVLKTSMQRLDSIQLAPRTEIILNILRYANSQEEAVHTP